MKDLLNTNQETKDGITILELTTLVAHYRNEASRARELATRKANENKAIFKDSKMPLPDAGAEFESLAQVYETALRKLAMMKLEASGLVIPFSTEIKDESGKEVTSSTKPEEEASEEIENEKIKEEAMRLVDLDLTFDRKKLIADLWTSGKTGEVVEGEVTEEDRNNPDYVIETRAKKDGDETTEVEVKRTLHDKELAVRDYDKLMKDKVDLTKISHQEKRAQIMAVVGEVKRISKEREEKSVIQKIKEIGVKEERETKVSFNGKELIDRHSKLIVGDSFNTLILLGSDDKDSVNAEDIVKLRAIQHKAVGEEKKAISILMNFYKDKGFTEEHARQFLYKLMRKDPFAELSQLIVNLFYHHQKSATDKTATTAWMAGLAMAKSLVKAYTRKFKVDGKGNKVMVDSADKKQQVPAFEYWPESKIDNFIIRCIEEASKAKVIPVNALDIYQKSLSPNKGDKDTEEEVSKKEEGKSEKSKSVDGKAKQKGENTKDKKAEPEKEESTTKTEETSTTEEEAGRDTTGTTSENTKESKIPEVEVVVKYSMGRFEGHIPELEDFTPVKTKRDGKQLVNAAQKAIRARIKSVHKAKALGKKTIPTLPKSLEGISENGLFKVVLITEKKEENK